MSLADKYPLQIVWLNVVITLWMQRNTAAEQVSRREGYVHCKARPDAAVQITNDLKGATGPCREEVRVWREYLLPALCSVCE